MEFAEGFEEEEEAQPRPTAAAATVKRGVDVDVDVDADVRDGGVAVQEAAAAARNGARGGGGGAGGSGSHSNSNSRAGNGNGDSSEEDDIIVLGQSGPAAANGGHGSSGTVESSTRERKQQPTPHAQHRSGDGGHTATAGSNGAIRAAPPASLNLLNASQHPQPSLHAQAGHSVPAPAEGGSGGPDGSLRSDGSRPSSTLGFSSYADPSSASGSQKPASQPFSRYHDGEKSPSFALPQPGSSGFGQPIRPNLYNLPQPGSSHQVRAPYAPYSGTASPASSTSPYGMPNSFSQMNSQYAASAAGLQHNGLQDLASTSRGIPWNMHSPAPNMQPIAPRPIPTPISASAFGYEHRQPGNNARPPSTRSAPTAQSGGGAVIDLTEDGDGDGDGDGQSSGGDDVVMQKEQMRPARKVAADASDDDDDLKIVGEKPTEQSAPLCIGQLTGVALILYPNTELQLGPDHQPGQVVAPIPILMLRMQPRQSGSGHRDETIKLYGGQTKTNFGVMEHRLANVLGPMMTRDNQRGLGIWIEGWVMRTPERSPIMLSMSMLLFCHPHIMPHVASALEKATVYLEHPLSYDPAMHNGFRYHNPHSTSLSHNREADRRRQQVLAGLSGHTGGGYQQGRFSMANSLASKSVEVKREQVEEMFKNIASGADLGEIEPNPMVQTKLYPHQKQALAFLLDREKLRTTDTLQSRRTANAPGAGVNGSRDEEDQMISLWRPARDAYGKFVGWHNVITEVEIGSSRPPPQCRGAILADDMGLGKTIVIISLVASTLDEAAVFAGQPVTRERNTTGSFDALAAHPSGNKAGQSTVQQAQFQSAIPGVTNNTNLANGAKKGKPKKETKTQKKREEHEVARLDRLVRRSRGTLIVCPLSTVVNWEAQIEEHIGLLSKPAHCGPKKEKKRPAKAKARSSDSEDDDNEEEACSASGASTPNTASGLSVYIYHGPDRDTNLDRLASFDVVITTFSTLGSEFSKQQRKEQQDEEGTESSDGGIEEVDAAGQPVKRKGKRKRKKIEGDAISPLQRIEWFRIVLDEAHQIKEHTTLQAHAACELAAERRVCLTGTPLQNSLNDLFSLMRFLKLEPFTDKGIWSTYIGTPAKLGDPLGVSRLQLLMRHLALRRTKQSTDKQGKPILSIPPKKEEVRYLKLDDQEKAFYSAHHSRYKHNFEQLEKTDSLFKNYCNVLQEILRLRQICVHMALVRDSEDRAAADDDEGGGDVVFAIKKYGISRPRALRLLALMRDTGAAQCAECDVELASSGLNAAQDDMEEDVKPAIGRKRPRKAVPAVPAARKGTGKAKAESDDNSTAGAGCASGINPSAPLPVLTRCQHLFCLPCFQKNVAVNYPDAITAADRATCSICREEMSPVIDAIQVCATDIDTTDAGVTDEPTRSRKGKNKQTNIVEHSTKIRELVRDLFLLSQNNPASVNYAGDAADLVACEPDEQFRPKPREATKTVVFSQWTSFLDRIEDALQEAKIKYARLDGGMNRVERTRALATFKSDLKCEVLLISLRAGGVGLNLTHASRVYVTEPSYNPAVEHQAIDRVHRLGQTRPVKCVRLIVEKSVEANMLEIQERKQKLASMSLSQTLSKAELAQQRKEDLRTLLQ